jgi:hypothetical protein
MDTNQKTVLLLQNNSGYRNYFQPNKNKFKKKSFSKKIKIIFLKDPIFGIN